MRLLCQIDGFLNKDEKYKNCIEVLISDNGSKDDTAEVVKKFISSKNNYQLYLQGENKGFDINIKFLYGLANSKFVWYFSDDDILYDNAFEMIVNSLEQENPDLMLFSFAQPPNSLLRTFNFPNSHYSTNNISEIIESVSSYPKLSIYILRKIDIPEFDQIYLDSIVGNGFYFLSLSFTIISLSSTPKLTIITKQLASCDDEFNNFSIPPNIFLYYYITFQHPFVLKECPNLFKAKKITSYITTLGYLFMIKNGSIIVNNNYDYDAYIKAFCFRGSILCTKPFLFFQFILLKAGKVGIYNKYGKKFYTKFLKPLRKIPN